MMIMYYCLLGGLLEFNRKFSNAAENAKNGNSEYFDYVAFEGDAVRYVHAAKFI